MRQTLAAGLARVTSSTNRSPLPFRITSLSKLADLLVGSAAVFCWLFTAGGQLSRGYEVSLGRLPSKRGYTSRASSHPGDLKLKQPHGQSDLTRKTGISLHAFIRAILRLRPPLEPGTQTDQLSAGADTGGWIAVEERDKEKSDWTTNRPAESDR